VRRIFLAEGVVIGGLGALIGIAIGYGLMGALAQLAMQPPGFTQTIQLPIYWGVDQVLLATAFAVLSAAGAAYLPARRAGRVQPVDILRGGMA
jgi:lipoprotein-releasing system permease protein